jgi:glucose/arabinose dehydrogenase
MRDGNPLTTFLTVNMITTGGERGLLSMAFSPDYATSRKFYVYYTDPQGTPTYSNHNGGQLQFGPDGYLYLATCDGGDRDDPFRSAQKPRGPRGKMLRIDPEVGPQLGSLTPSPKTIRSSGFPGATRSGRTACGIRGGSRSTDRRAISSSLTSDRISGRRSTSRRPRMRAVA